MRVKFFYLIAFLFLVSCTPRNLAYFSDLQQQAEYSENIQNNTIPKIQLDDLLSITVASLSPEANAVFNRDAVHFLI